MLKIKLLPRGKKHQITYRIVVSEARSKYNGNFVADLGFYTPQTKTLNLDKEAMATWIKNGAQLTTGVDKLLNPDKYPNKFKNEKVAKAPKEEVSSESEAKSEEAPTENSEVKAEEAKVEETTQEETKVEEAAPEKEPEEVKEA